MKWHMWDGDVYVKREDIIELIKKNSCDIGPMKILGLCIFDSFEVVKQLSTLNTGESHGTEEID